jgi:outer membrane protein
MSVRASLIIMILMATAFIFPLHPAHGEAKLTLQDCIDRALKNQPSLLAARANIDAGMGRETQAASPYFPQVTASTGYNESRQLGGALGGETTSKSYTTTLQVNQLIYDFGKTGNTYDAARWGTRSSEQDAERVRQEVVLNVKQAFFALLQAEQLVAVAEKTVEQTESHLSQAQAFFRAGSRPRFDVTRAEVDVNNAKLSLINAKNSVRIRTIALNNAMGTDPGQATHISDVLPQVPPLPSLEQALADALKNRPEYNKSGADIEAAKARVKAEESNYRPSLSASGAYNWAHGTTETDFGGQALPGFSGQSIQSDIQDSWNAGITLTVPLFQGGLTRGRVSEARASLLALEAQRIMIKQSILLELNQAFADLEGATARVEVMESTVKKAQENLALAQGRYEAGIGPYIEVTDAQLSAVNAETDYIQALNDYQLAVARLLKAIGASTPS